MPIEGDQNAMLALRLYCNMFKTNLVILNLYYFNSKKALAQN